MNVLVTGGSGYIGANIIEALEERGHSARNYDLKASLDILNLKGLREHSKGCDVICHLAAVSGIRECEADPEQAVKTNVCGTLKVLRAGRPVVFTSSLAAKTPRNLYGYTKRIGETLCLEHGATVLRYSNVYGGKNYLETKNSVIARFLRQKLRGEFLTVYGGGAQVRDFVHISDVVAGTVRAMESHPKGVYEICTGKPTRIIDLALKISDKVAFVDKDVGVEESVGEYRPALRAFGYKPSVTLEEGLRTLGLETLVP